MALLTALPIVEIKIAREDGLLVSTIRLRPQVANLLILGIAALVGTVFLAYFFAENYAAVYW